MTTEESLTEIAHLRLRFQMNNRLRLESLAALSKVFREHGEPIQDELLSSLVLAVPEELLGLSSSIRAEQPYTPGEPSTPSQRPTTPGHPPPPRPPGRPPRPPVNPTPGSPPSTTPEPAPLTTPGEPRIRKRKPSR